jgi:hypothetical protein
MHEVHRLLTYEYNELALYDGRDHSTSFTATYCYILRMWIKEYVLLHYIIAD